MKDSFGREIDYMRISITDRCNLRCRYCMPEGISLVPSEEILSFEEIMQICQAAAELGICRFKLTGGEPLVRPDCPKLVGMIKKIPSTKQVTLTTNGILLDELLDDLMENGLDGVNISLDSLDNVVYEQITGFDELLKVKKGIDRAVKKGMRVKVNSVLQKGINDKEWLHLIELARERQIDVRFIEMMPIGFGKKSKGIDGNEVLLKLKDKYPGVKPDSSVHGNGPAVYYQIPGFKGSIGFISAVHRRFCGECNRVRLTAKGELKPCLCYEAYIDTKKVLRGLAYTDPRERKEGLKQALSKAIALKPEMHCFEAEDRITERRQMVQIGG